MRVGSASHPRSPARGVNPGGHRPRRHAEESGEAAPPGEARRRDRRVPPRGRGPAARLDHREHARRPLRPRRPARQGGRAVRAASPSISSTRAFIPKAAAIYKKILKLKPDDEAVAADTSPRSRSKQGLLADAKAQLNAVAARRRGAATAPAPTRSSCGSARSTRPISRRVALAARTLAEMGDEEAPPPGSAPSTTTCSRKDREPRRCRRCGRRSSSIPHDQEGAPRPGQGRPSLPAISRAPGRFSIARPPATIPRC